MRAIAFVSRLVRQGTLDAGRYKDLRLHMVADDDGLAPYNASSKFNTDWAFLQELFELGRKAANHWLRYHRQDIGVRGSLYAGMPKRIMPPGSREASNTVTS